MASDPHSRYRIVGTAGHIDHGKSALVKALTGSDPDRLQEERERGITIDLGFAHALIGDTRIGFIDVPGHERFVKNMLAGVGGIDAVLLVVAADESIMPQTREHFAICRLLGITHGVVAITKCDLVEDELVELVELEVRDLLAGTPLREAPIVRTSVKTGLGIDALAAALGECVRDIPARPVQQLPRMAIDRVFTVRGFGTVVTGTLVSGSIRVGDTVEIAPKGLSSTVRTIQVHGTDTEVAIAGQRTALNLQSLEVGQLDRGDVVTSPGALRPTHLLDARIEVLEAFEAVDHLQRVRFHHGAAEILARVATLEGDRVTGGSAGFVQLRLERPYVAAPGDRFILRRYSPLITLGGGVIVDNAPRKHRPGRVDVQRLRQLADASPPQRVALWVAEAGLAGLEISEIGQRLACPPDSALVAMQDAGRAGAVIVLGSQRPRAVPRRAFETLRTELVETISRYHERFPLRPGAPKPELQQACTGRPDAEVLQAALDELVAQDEVRQVQDGYALCSHLVRLPRELEPVRQQILQAFETAGLAPPAVEAVLAAAGSDPKTAREVFHFLLRSGELVRVRDDLVMHGEVLAKLVDAFRAQFARGATLSVADFKDWARITRKHAIPLLEYLDSRRITRRVGDGRERI